MGHFCVNRVWQYTKNEKSENVSETRQKDAVVSTNQSRHCLRRALRCRYRFEFIGSFGQLLLDRTQLGFDIRSHQNMIIWQEWKSRIHSPLFLGENSFLKTLSCVMLSKLGCLKSNLRHGFGRPVYFWWKLWISTSKSNHNVILNVKMFRIPKNTHIFKHSQICCWLIGLELNTAHRLPWPISPEG